MKKEKATARAAIAALALLTMIPVLAGCTNRTTNESQDEPAAYQTLRIIDGYSGMYEESINIELDASDAPDIIKAVLDAESAGQAAGGLPWYAVEFLNSSGRRGVLLTVYSNRTVSMASGEFRRREGKLDEALTAIEDRCGIDFSLVDRKPGDKYFALARYAENGNLYEFTENNFIEGLDFELTREQIDELIGILQEYAGGFEKGEEEPLYRVSLYTEHGAELYVLDFTESGDIYVGNWKMDSPELNNWAVSVTGK